MKRDVHALPVLLVFVLLISLSTAVEVSATTPRHARHLRSTGTSPLTVTFCLSGVKGVGLTMPSSSNYNKARLSYNLRTQAYPAFMVYVKTVNQVSQVVKCANTHGYRVVPRGGGASFEGYSSQSGTVVLDMDIKSFGGITLSKDKKTAMVSAGAQLKDVYTTLWEAGRYVTPGGTVGLVGFSGCALGGCFGFLTRKYGMACDNVVEVQAVLANGKIVRANSAKDADLLWASRGGGGGQYAIITQFKMKVYQQPTGSTATSVSYTWDLNKATAVKGLAWYQNSVQKLPNEYSGAFSVQGDKGGRVTLTGIFLGKTKDQTKAAFAAAGLFAALGHPNKDASYFNTVRSALGYTYVPPAKYFKSKSVSAFCKHQSALDGICWFNVKTSVTYQVFSPRATDVLQRPNMRVGVRPSRRAASHDVCSLAAL